MSYSLPPQPMPAQLEFLSLLLPLSDRELSSQSDTVPTAATALTPPLQSQTLAAPTAPPPPPRRSPRSRAKPPAARGKPHNASALQTAQLPLFESAVDSDEPLGAAPDPA